jgi:DNA-binding NarL/FixJ family response regulator
VAIIADQRETREGLSFLVNSTDRFECQHVYASTEAALERIGANPPRVALVDIGLPGISGIDGTRILRERRRHPINPAVDRFGSVATQRGPTIQTRRAM